MQRTISLKVVTAALFTSLIAAPASAAGDYPPCGTFVLMGGGFKIEGLDLGPKGDGMSDERITKQKLFDADGNFAGVARLVHIVVEPEEDSDGDVVTLGINAFSLPEGTLYGQVLMDYKSDFWDDELPKDTARIAVVGGTRAYVRSKGQIVVTFDTKRLTPTRAEFQLFCE
jgi:hypothetical protein